MTYLNKQPFDPWMTKVKEYVEEKGQGSYVGVVALRTKSGEWINQPCLLFYSDTKRPEGSNYFAYYYKYAPFDTGAMLMVTDGISAVEEKEGNPIAYTALVNEETNEFTFSAYRHDYQEFYGRSIDGGRDYTRVGTLEKPESVTKRFIIKKGKIVFNT